MADEEKTVEDVQKEKSEDTPKEQERTFTKEELNNIVEERLARERKKYANFKEIKEAAEQSEELSKEVDKLKAQAQRIADENASLKHEKDVAEWKKAASKEFGIDPTILRGNTEEEIKAHAEQIKKTIAYPKVELGGEPLDARVEGLTDRQKTEKAFSGLFTD